MTTASSHIFAPGVISSRQNDFAPAFSQDMSWLFFTRGDNGLSSIFFSRRKGRSWSTPAVAPFSGRWVDLEASLAPDDSYMVFASNRPASDRGAPLQALYFGKTQVGGNLWRVDRAASGWGKPYRLSSAINIGNSVWTPSIARNGDLYFMATDAKAGRFRLHVAAQGKEIATRNLAFSTGAANDVDPYIAPDESFLIFSSDRGAPGRNGLPGRERLYIAFRPMTSAPLVCRLDIPGFEDISLSEIEARLSPDRKNLYFASRRAAHEQGQPVAGPWDNGKGNIWSVPFRPSLWNGGAAQPAACAPQTI